MAVYIPSNWPELVGERGSKGAISETEWFREKPGYTLLDYKCWSEHYQAMNPESTEKERNSKKAPVLELDFDLEFFKAEYMVATAVKLAMKTGRKSAIVLCHISEATKAKLEPIMKYLGLRHSLKPMFVRTYSMKVEWDFSLSEETKTAVEHITRVCKAFDKGSKTQTPTSSFVPAHRAVAFAV